MSVTSGSATGESVASRASHAGGAAPEPRGARVAHRPPVRVAVDLRVPGLHGPPDGRRRSSCRSRTSIRAARTRRSSSAWTTTPGCSTRPDAGQVAVVTVRFAILIVPATMAFALGRRDARQQHAARGPERLPDALLHADPDPDRRQHRRSGSASSTPRPAGSTTASAAIGIARHRTGSTARRWVHPSLTLMGLWGIGNMMLIFLAGSQGVPTELYDAAKVDGAGRWASFRHITLPMISTVIFYNLSSSLIGDVPVLHPGLHHQQRPGRPR